MKKCKFLNTKFGEGYYICMFKLKPVGSDKLCQNCKYNTEGRDENGKTFLRCVQPRIK